MENEATLKDLYRSLPQVYTPEEGLIPRRRLSPGIEELALQISKAVKDAKKMDTLAVLFNCEDATPEEQRQAKELADRLESANQVHQEIVQFIKQARDRIRKVEEQE